MKVRFRPIACILFLLVAGFSSLGQPPHAFFWYTSKGDPSLKTIHHIIQDPDGFIWLATWDGLLRFDGYQFERHILPPDKPTNRFIALKADRNGDIWTISYDNALFRFAPRENRFIPIDTGGKAITRIIETDGYGFFLTTAENQILFVDIESDKAGAFLGSLPEGTELYGSFPKKDGSFLLLTSTGVQSPAGSFGFNAPALCAAETGGILYFGSSGGKIFAQSEDGVRVLSLPTAADIYSISPIPGGKELLVGSTAADVFIINPTGGRTERLRSPSLLSGTISTLTDVSGNLWVYSASGGLDWYDPAARRLIPFYDDKLDRQGWNGENRVTAVFCDRQGILWAGTNWNGLMKVVLHDDRFYLDAVGPSFETAPENSVRALYQDMEKRIWVTTKDGRIHLYDRDMVYQGDLFSDGSVRMQLGDLQNSIYANAQDRQGTLWFGSRQNGLIEAERIPGPRIRFRITHYPKEADAHYGLNGEQIFSLYADRNNRLWIASFDDGLSYLDLNDPERRFISKKNRFSFPTEEKNRLRAISPGPDGSLLACGTLGLFVCANPGKEPEDLEFKRYFISGEDHPSGARDLQYAFTSRGGQIYVCSYGAGFNHFSKDGAEPTFSAITTRDGLLSNFTLSAVQDSTGRIWIATDEGLNRYDPATRRIESYTYDRIGYDIHFNEGVPLYADNGEIYFGSTQGVLHFHPERISNSSYVPPLLVTAAGAAGKALPFKQDKEAVIRSGQPLEVHFQAMDLSQPQQILYYYRLDGKDSDWIPAGNERSITLSHLRPGNYALHLRSTNASGIEVDNETILPFTVRVRPALSVWAILLYLTLAAGILAALYWERRRRRLLEEPYYGSLHGADREFIKELVTFLSENLENTELDVPEMAARMNVSRSVLFERTKTLLDKSPAALLREIRFEKAKALIREGKHSLSQITFMTGFNDPHYFSSAFKRQFGMTPSDYKKSLGRN